MFNDSLTGERLAEMLANEEDNLRYLTENDWGVGHIRACQSRIAILTELQSLRSKPMASGVEVKPLEWVKDTRWRFEADSLLGRYTAYCPDDKKGFWRLSLGSHHNLIGNFDSLEEAKAAAEADYRNRIMSALLPKATAPVVSEPVFWAVHSATGVHIGLWPKVEDAMKVWQEYPDGRLTPLYASPQLPEVTEEGVERAAKAMWEELQGYGVYPWGHPAEPGSLLEAEFKRARQKARAALEAFVKGE